MGTEKHDRSKNAEAENLATGFSKVSGVIGFIVGLLISVAILGVLFAVMFGVGLTGVDPGALFWTGIIVGLVIALITPFALMYWFGSRISFGDNHTQRTIPVDSGSSENLEWAASRLTDRQPVQTSELRSFINLWRGTNGRLGRAEFFAIELIVLVLAVVGLVAVALLIGSVNPWLVYLAACIASVSPITRRLHDLDLTGLITPVFFVPYLGQIFLLALFVAPGGDRPNKYDSPDPEMEAVDGSDAGNSNQPVDGLLDRVLERITSIGWFFR